MAMNNFKGDIAMIFKSGKYKIAPMFVGNTFFMSSEEFPAIQEVIKMFGMPVDKLPAAMQAPERVRDVAAYLKDHSLMQAFTDEGVSPELLGEIIEWKTIELKEYLKHELSEEKLYGFYNRFLQEHLFETVDIDLFCEEFMKEFGMDLKERLRTWYTRDHLPVLLLEDVVLTELPEEEGGEGRQSKSAYGRFKVYNPGDVEGVLVVSAARIKGEKVRSFLIQGHECKEIRVKMDYRGLMITSPLVQNIPSGRWVLTDEIRPFEGDTLTGVFPADSTVFLPRPGEIIVNNRDEGFRLVEPQGEKLFTLLRGGPKSWDKARQNYERWVEMVDNRFYEPWFMMLIVRVSGKGNIKLNGQLRFQKQGNTRYIFIMEISLKWECFSRRERKVHVYIIPCMIHRGGMKSELNRQRNRWDGSL